MTRKENNLVDKHIKDYQVKETRYRTGYKTELWRLNKKYGYYNFVTYLDNKEQMREKILEDLQNSKNEK